MRSRWLLFAGASLVATAVAVTLQTVSAQACDFPPAEEHETDAAEEAVDMMLPGLAGIDRVAILRGWDRSDDCDGIGEFLIHLVVPADDRTPQQSMGYVLMSDFDGVLDPNHMALRAPGGEILLTFRDLDSHRELDFDLTVAAVDLAGNVGPTSAPFHVYHPGAGCLGCSAGRAAPRGAAAWLLAAGLAGLVLRRRRRARRHSA